jgi:hypothetical protein
MIKIAGVGGRSVFRLPAFGEVGGEILFGFSFRQFRARDRLFAMGVAGALQQQFCCGFILLSGWVYIAPFLCE